MSVFVFGSKGMLGSYICKRFSESYNVVPVSRAMLDLSGSPEAIFDFLRSHVSKEDIIINAAGVIKQRKSTLEEMFKVNSVFPSILALLKKDISCQVWHITTDCVFSGKKGGYTEDSLHDCDDFYGISKSLGENSFLSIIRTSIIGEEASNKLSLLEWVRSNTNGEINGFDNHFWNGVTCLELATFLKKLVDENCYWNGVRHIYSPEIVSKYDLVNLINNVYSLNMRINKKSADVFCDRSLKSNYVCQINKSLNEQIKELRSFHV
jgi:dTDP-4-dehydrorhamnose reductase